MRKAIGEIAPEIPTPLLISFVIYTLHLTNVHHFDFQERFRSVPSLDSIGSDESDI